MSFDPFVDDRNTQRKKAWVARHPYVLSPPEVWCSLCGEVTSSTVNNIIRAVAQAPPGSPVILSVDSHGGNPLAALDLFNVLRGHSGPVTTMAAGCCYSAAAVIFL